MRDAREWHKLGKPVDLNEWGMTPPTVNAYFNPQMNDINFPAGVLQPPLYDAKLDDAPNYGNTGATIGHELTHAFDDEGRQFDAKGNLKDWWTPADAKGFEDRINCVRDQYAGYVIVDDIHINSKLTSGEDVADLGGTLLAYIAWKKQTASERLKDVDGFTPDQRFFVGMAQWACENERPENLRVSAITDPHSPGFARINGVVTQHAGVPEGVRLQGRAADGACADVQGLVGLADCSGGLEGGGTTGSSCPFCCGGAGFFGRGWGALEVTHSGRLCNRLRWLSRGILDVPKLLPEV